MWAETMVYLERADNLFFDEERLPGAQIVKGNVLFRHDEVLMYCDSAYFFRETNSLDAFGRIKMEQGDTLTGYSDKLFYNGNTKIARFRQNVKLIHHESVLTTDSLNYNRTADIAYYYSGGKITDELNVLTSLRGQYTPYNKMATFRDSVHLVNSRFTMDTDTLRYNTEDHMAYLVSPTTILYEQETTICSSNGIYNTQTEQSELFDRSMVLHAEGKSLVGDTIYYDKQNKFGKVLGGMRMTDSVQEVTLYGDYGEVYEQESALAPHPEWGAQAFATQNAVLEAWGDSVHTWMHADTLFTENPPLQDTTKQDTTYQRIRAYHHVRVYREDMQAVCDSEVYIGSDSIGKLYGEPIAWADNQQVSADSIYAFFRDSVLDHLHGWGSILCAQQVDTVHYHQMAGKEMIAYIKDGDISQVDVSGNAETIFYPKDENDHTLSGCNRTESSFVKFYFTDGEIDHALFTTATSGTLYPMKDLTDAIIYLGQFFWAELERPRSPQDVMNHVARTQRTNK